MFRVVVALVVLLSIPARADRAEATGGAHDAGPNPPIATCGTGGSGPQASCGGRPQQSLTEAQMRYTTPLVNLFGKTIEGYIVPVYGPRIRDAVVAAKEQKNVAPLSEILADLFNTVDSKQIDQIRTEATKIRDAEKEKSTNRDDLLITLMDKVIDATGVIKGGAAFVAKAEEMPFNQQFSKDYDKAFANPKKLEFFEKLKQANAEPPSPEAKNWLRTELNQASLFGWAIDKGKNGLASLANQVLNGVSWSNGGQKFVDMWGKANEAQRVFLGTSTDLLAQAMQAFQTFSHTNGLGSPSLASVQHPSPKKEWFYDPSKKSIEKGRPNGVTLPAAGGAPVASGGIDSTVKTGTGTAKASTAPAANLDGVLTSLKGAGCAGCHGGEFVKEGNAIVYKKDGKTFSAAEAKAAVERIPGMSSIKGAAAAVLSSWVALQ